ncbi:hypothetical protein NVP1101O_084 [Vibrio phage 1.101.O._10N.261.45.C6]|nr:hypothetical protein NVP1101O_084 [Vibrio phage 1.101.O._10N.261.45.C6]
MGMRQPYKVHAKFTKEQWEVFNTEAPDWLREVWRSAAYFEEFDEANPDRKIIVEGEDGLLYVTLTGHSKGSGSEELYEALHNKCEGYTFLVADCDGDYPSFYESNYGSISIHIEDICHVVFDGEGLVSYEALSSRPEVDIVKIDWNDKLCCYVSDSKVRDIYTMGAGFGFY